MPTVSIYLKMMDQFSSSLQRVNTGVHAVIAAMERLKRTTQAPMTINVDTMKAADAIERTRNLLGSRGPSSTIRLVIDSDGAMQEMNRIRQRLQSVVILVRARVILDAVTALRAASALRDRIMAATRIAVPVSMDSRAVSRVAFQIQNLLRSSRQQINVDVMFNVAQIVRRAVMLRSLLQHQLNGIQARIRIELPASLSAMFAGLQRLVLSFIVAIRQLQLVAARPQIVYIQQNIFQPQSSASASADPPDGPSNKWVSRIKGIASKFLSLKKIMEGIKISDDYMNATSKLLLINDGLQTQAELQEKIFAAANRSRSAYTSMADTVTKLGVSAPNAFENNDEMIGFAELMKKSLVISGKDEPAQQSGVLQLTKAMSAGGLQGGELMTLVESAPAVVRAIESYTGFGIDKLQELAGEGKLTSDVIKASLFAAADEINGKFDAMPMTFGNVFEQIRNGAFQAFGPTIEKIYELLNSEMVKSFIDAFLQGLSLLGSAIVGVLDAFQWLGDVIGSLYSTIEPLLFMIGSAFALWAITQIPLLIAQLNAMMIRLWLMLEPILAQAAAWLLANWPILLIGAAIGFLVYALYRWKETTVQVIGFIGGIFGTLFALLYNHFAHFANIIMSVAEFFINVWKDPVYALKKLMLDLVTDALSYFRNLAAGIENIVNKIPGLNIDITGGMDRLLHKLENARDNLHSEEDVVSLMRFEQMDPAEAFDAGQKFGEKIGTGMADGVQWVADKIGDLFSGSDDFGSAFDVNGLDEFPTTPTIPDIGKVNEVGKIRDTVDISSEDLKTMRELAEMNNIQNFVTLQPQLTFGDTNVRQDGRSIEEIVANIAERMEQELAASARGVFNV